MIVKLVLDALTTTLLATAAAEIWNISPSAFDGTATLVNMFGAVVAVLKVVVAAADDE